ncbi:MAG: hypothetical protein LBB74_09225 [Chitinispirillales bacterium]|jgi:REP element-mobilizing transposase RayT|nr:hypothetical protein [Chitinispirillales bacterium]
MEKMFYHPVICHRRSIRLKGYDYSQAGFYFVTVCVQDRKCLFGKVIDGWMVLNEYGQIVNDEWQGLKVKYPHIVLHKYAIMPNHFHCIIEIAAHPVPGNANNNAVVGAGSARPVHYSTDPTHHPKPAVVDNDVGAGSARPVHYSTKPTHHPKPAVVDNDVGAGSARPVHYPTDPTHHPKPVVVN